MVEISVGHFESDWKERTESSDEETIELHRELGFGGSSEAP